MNHHAHVTLLNGEEVSSLSLADRGLAYGDGLFETIRVAKDGSIPLLSYHLSRFEDGLKRLRFSDSESILVQFKHNLLVSQKRLDGEAVIKVILTRGSGGRGYAIPDAITPSLIIQTFDMPVWPPVNVSKGIECTFCKHHLSSQPALAGIKHLNRLDQVLAASELDGEQEGFVFDQKGLLIEGTKSNVILFMDDRVVTPKLTDCGVNGVLRRYLLDSESLLGFAIQEEDISLDRLQEAKGLACINSLIGIWPVVKIPGRELPIDPRCEKVRKVLCRELGLS